MQFYGIIFWDHHALQLHSGFCCKPPRSSHGLCGKYSEVFYIASFSSQGLGSFSRVLLSRSSSHRYKGKWIRWASASKMFLSLHMIFSLERAAVWAILERILGFDPSLEMIAPRYLKFSTASSLWPFILTSLWKPFGLFVLTFILSGPISILYLVMVVSRRSTRTPASSPSSTKFTMSSAKRKLVIRHPLMLTLPSWSSNASHNFIWASSRENLSSGVCDQATLKLACSATETGWSAPLLFAYGIRQVFSWWGSYNNQRNAYWEKGENDWLTGKKSDLEKIMTQRSWRGRNFSWQF